MEEKSLIILNKVVLEKSKSIDNENKTTEKENELESVYYYDKYSRKILDVNETGIKIYNRKAKNLKANILINIPKESLLLIITDKSLKYLICLLINEQENKKFVKTKLILINTKDKKFFDKIEENFLYLLGMFFIGKINNLINLDSNNQNELNDFCLIHCDKVVFYGIETKNNKEEYCKKISTINTVGSILIKDFSYDYKHKILCLVKTDLSISFLILTNRKNYKNLITPKFAYIKTLKEKISLMGMFRKVSDDQKRSIKAHFDNLDRYTESQFYLETIYNSLYLICLCYEDNKIYIHKLENLNAMGTILNIDYSNHAHFSALQVIDNLIIVHNYLTKLIVVIDIKSKSTILRTFKVNFPYQNNLHINGEILEERKIFNKKRMITVYGGTLYNMNFNGQIYDQLTDADFQKRKKKKKDELKLKEKNNKKDEEMNRYDVLTNLLHRKGTNNLILSILYRLILKGEENPVYLIQFFKELIDLDNKAKEKVEIISDKKLVKKELSDSHNPYEVPHPFNIVLAKKNYIKQIDILMNLFAKFENEYSEKGNSDNKIKENKINCDDKFFLRIIFYMCEFCNLIIMQQMELKPIFHSIILKYIKNLKQKEKIIPLIIYKNIPYSPELGKYLFELSMNKNDIHCKEYENLGLKVLRKIKVHDIIIDYLLKSGKIAKAMNYMSEIFNQLSEQEINDIFEKNRDIIEKNKELLLNYIK